MLPTALYLISLIIVLAFTTILFFIAQVKKDNSIIDIAYGLGFITTAGFLTADTLKSGTLPSSSVIILILVIIWGLRLAARIYIKNKGKPEDFRYQSWRKEWNKKGSTYYFARTYLQIFILQGFIISIVLLPFTLSLSATHTPNHLILLGIVIWIIGFSFEAVGDKQLDTFIKDKTLHKDTIMKTGLWKYTRHPNYFGESTMWFGLAFIALSTGASYIALLSPFLISYLLLFVSGIPLLEKHWEGISEWEVYKAKTSAFFPFPPKSK
jgi:steroid 5-alpha reductase family enzyme